MRGGAMRVLFSSLQHLCCRSVGAAQRMRDSFAFLPIGQKQWFGSVEPSPATVHRTVALKSSNPHPRPIKKTTRWVVFFIGRG